MADAAVAIDIQRILGMLPHRYPFLLVDRVTEVDYEARSITAYKNVTVNEPFFQGHFPGLPVMPGVLIMEALAQAGGLYVLSHPELDLNGKLFLFASADKVKFRRPVVPGDQLFLHVSDFRRKMTLWKMSAVAKVNGETAAAGEFSAAMVNKEIF
ncbi:3-hydroxyacyl-ACP dehydratase FabZ [Desulfovibrio aminophilus]|nr:3-hydroxyacyl-ACP dehydratase FabZ [Desulfovibrio aminophilus]MCM0756228.1 3-hydroxyacyl-ACP dehydratase FabZ [Desulfovibrio aminophilus]